MVCSHSLAGVAPGEAPKAEATELAPEAVGASPPVATRYLRALTGPARLEGFPVGTRSASGETPERRLWAIEREDRRACPAHKMVIHLSLR